MARSFVQLPGYEIGKQLGKGAGAVIYVGTELASRRKVAVKHIVRHGPADEKFLVQAENEYEVARKLDHPNIRRCYDLIRVRRWLKTYEMFLVMELVEGEQLDQRFRDGVPERFEYITELFIQIAQGLQAMHRAGYLHTDMKPINVLVSGDGVKIIDLGQACPIGTSKERVQGTPDYMAPEQVRSGVMLDQRTDVFNLGATMYHVCTGKAFATLMPSAPAGALKIDVEERRNNEAPNRLNPRVPLPLSALIMDCCATERDQRPWDMSKVISRLETVKLFLDRKEGSTGRALP